jgi:hypothetical protein
VRPLPVAALALVLAAAAPGAAQAAFTIGSTPAAGAGPEAIAVVDYNEDGAQDLAVANAMIGGTVTLLTGSGSGTFAAGGTLNVGNTPVAIGAGDFNGDGDPDLAIANSEVFTPGGAGSVTIYSGNGSGGFTVASSPAVNHPRSIAVGDFNADGFQDIATANTDAGTVSILIGAGNGTFTHLPAEPSAGPNADALAVGDFNGDGSEDLAVARPGFVRVLRGAGDGSFTLGVATAVAAFPQALSVGDVNGDDIQDVVTANYSTASVSVLIGKGDGTFTRVSPDPATGATPTDLAIGDFDGDGDQDLATADSTPGGPGTMSVLDGNGAGGFSAPSAYPAGARPWAIAAGEFNGDRNQDLAVTNSASVRTVSVMLSTDPPSTANLLDGGDAEAPGAAGTSSAFPAPPGWTRDQGNFTYVRYGSAYAFLRSLLAPTIRGGLAFFTGGPSSPTSSVFQTVDVSGRGAAIDAGLATARLSGLLGGFRIDPDNALVTATFLDGGGSALGTPLQIGPVTVADRHNVTTLLPRATSGLVPAGTRRIRVRILATRLAPNYNNAYADGLSLAIAEAAPPVVPPPPGPGPGLGPGPGVVPPAVVPPVVAVAPVLSKLTLTPSKFRAVRAPTGTKVGYSLDRTATVTFTVLRRSPGVRKGKKCVAPPRKPAKGSKPKRCTRSVALGSFTRASAAGATSFRFTGRVKSKALAAGKYTLTATAKTTAGKSSKTLAKPFTVVR